MEDVNQYLDCDVYQVEIDKSTGKKVIHIDGFCYCNDEEFLLVQGTFCYMDIDGTQCTEKAQEIFENTKQYHSTVSWEEVEVYYKRCTPLPYDEVTQGTPCGFYVN